MALPQLRNEPIGRKIGKARSGGANGRSTVPGHEQTDQRPLARLQAARGFERDQGTQAMPEEDCRETGTSQNFVGYALGHIVNRLQLRLMKPIPGFRQLHHSDICAGQPVTPAAERG